MNQFFKIQIKYHVLIMLFCISSTLCYSQKKSYFYIEELSFPNVLRISVQEKDHADGIIYIEEYLIYRNSFIDSNQKIKSKTVVHIHTFHQNLLVTQFNIDTLIMLDKKQEKILLDYYDFIYNNKIPEKYQGEEYIPVIAGVSVTYTMEIARKKDTFTDRRHLSLATLLLFNKNNW